MLLGVAWWQVRPRALLLESRLQAPWGVWPQPRWVPLPAQREELQLEPRGARRIRAAPTPQPSTPCAFTSTAIGVQFTTAFDECFFCKGKLIAACDQNPRCVWHRTDGSWKSLYRLLTTYTQ